MGGSGSRTAAVDRRGVRGLHRRGQSANCSLGSGLQARGELVDILESALDESVDNLPNAAARGQAGLVWVMLVDGMEDPE